MSRSRTTPLDAADQATLRGWIAAEGLEHASVRVGVPASTLARAACGAGVFRTTRRAIRAAIDQPRVA